MLVLADDMGDVGHPLLAVAHQRVDGVLFGGVGRALAAHDDGAELERHLLHVGDLDVGLEAAHVAGLVLAHDELEVVLAGGEGEAGGVLDVLLLHLLVGIDGEVDRLAHLADRDVLGVLDLAEEVDGCLVLVLDGGDMDLRAGDDHGDGDVELAVGQAEVEGLEVDGDVGGGELAAHLLGEGEFAVLGLGVLEVGRGVVAGAVLQLGVGMVLERDGEMTVCAVAPGVGGVVADDVVGLGVVLHLLEGGGEVVGVGEELAAGVGGEGAEGLLRAEVGAELGLHGCAAVCTGAAAAALGGVAHGVEGLQAANVHRIHRRVVLDALVGGGADAGLVLDALLGEAAGEVQHALLLLHLCH